jgi:hypothetical protein
LDLLMVVPDAAPPAGAERAEGLRVRRTQRKLHAQSRPRAATIWPWCATRSGRAQAHEAVGPAEAPALRLDDWNTWARWFEAAGVATPTRPGPVLNRAAALPKIAAFRSWLLAQAADDMRRLKALQS